MSEHTPTPWRSGGHVGFDLRILANQGPIEVCPAVAHGEADARFIVRACNAHDDLVRALEAAAEFIKDQDAGNPQEETGWKSDEALAAWIAARDALAKATS